MVNSYISSHGNVPARRPIRFAMAAHAALNTVTLDRNRINTIEPWEIKYWTERFGVSEQELKDAVFTVGSIIDDVKKHLGKS